MNTINESINQSVSQPYRYFLTWSKQQTATSKSTEPQMSGTVTRKPCYRKENRAMRPILWMPWKISGVPGYAHACFSLKF